MLYIDRIDKEKNKTYLYDTDMKYLYAVSPKSSKVKSCVNATLLPNSELGYYDDVLAISTTDMLLYNTKNATAITQLQGGNRIVYVYVNGYMFEIALAGASIHVNYEITLRLRSPVSAMKFRYMYQYRGWKYYGITMVDTRTLDIYQLKFDDKGSMYCNGNFLCKGKEISLNTFRRITLLTA